MIRFLRLWLVPILALLMLAGIAVAFVPLTQRAEERAETELTQLVEKAFARIEGEELEADPAIAAQKENLLSKAAAVARFLAHDDTLLDSDALLALCDQLSADRIDVADAEGTLIASSDDSRIGLPLGAQDAFVWTLDAAADPSAALAQTDEATPEVLYACVPRQDIDGFVLLTKEDSYIASALVSASVESLVSDLPYGEDMLFESDAAGADGFFREAGNLCLRRTLNGVTLIAARPLTAVFAVRNAVLLAFTVSLVCVAICAVADYLLRLEPLVTVDESDSALNPGAQSTGLLPEESETAKKKAAKPRGRRRKPEADDEDAQKTVIELPEADNPAELNDDASAEMEDSIDLEIISETQKPGRTHKKRRHTARDEERVEIDEDAFDKIVE
ncbi:MAG: hypothetical protein R2912_06715 [Eubacteriales bacterium]